MLNLGDRPLDLELFVPRCCTILCCRHFEHCNLIGSWLQHICKCFRSLEDSTFSSWQQRSRVVDSWVRIRMISHFVVSHPIFSPVCVSFTITTTSVSRYYCLPSYQCYHHSLYEFIIFIIIFIIISPPHKNKTGNPESNEQLIVAFRIQFDILGLGHPPFSDTCALLCKPVQVCV